MIQQLCADLMAETAGRERFEAFSEADMHQAAETLVTGKSMGWGTDEAESGLRAHARRCESFV